MRAALAPLAGEAALVFAADGDGGDAVARLRGAAGTSDMVLLVIEGRVPELDRAMLLAAIGPLAAEFAPRVRLAALDMAAGAAPGDGAAAAGFLVAARSTTGQVLRVAPRG